MEKKRFTTLEELRANVEFEMDSTGDSGNWLDYYNRTREGEPEIGLEYDKEDRHFLPLICDSCAHRTSSNPCPGIGGDLGTCPHPDQDESAGSTDAATPPADHVCDCGRLCDCEDDCPGDHL